MIAEIILSGILIFIVATTMTMVGNGGGNFYVVILVMAGITIHEAAATGQFILFSASVVAIAVFQKNRSVSWTLAILIGTITALPALGGGYFSHLFSGFILKFVFSLMLLITGLIILFPVKENVQPNPPKHFGTINLKSNGKYYRLNLWIILPVAVFTGFASGMVGVSGGSFLVPLMVLAARIPMHLAVGTASSLIATTALMGFTGHAIQGDFNPAMAIPLSIITIIGGILGGKLALKIPPKNLKRLFAYTNWFAALFMIYNAFHINS